MLRSALAAFAVIFAVASAASCASSRASSVEPTTAGARVDEEQAVDGAAVVGDAEDGSSDVGELGDSGSQQVAASRPPPRREPLPNPEGFAPTRGHKRIDAHVVWDCDMYTLAVDSGAILRGAEELEAAIDRSRASDGDVSRYCRGEIPTTTDFERYALAVVRLEYMASVSYAAVRDGKIELGVTRSAYCGGPAPPGPFLALVEVPRSAVEIAVVRRSVGACKGPPAP